MPASTPKFLRNPAEIRRAVRNLQGGKRLDLAVAFVGADWWRLLGDHNGKLRLVCWLSSTNTDPRAVEDLMKHRPNTVVKQRHSMHCKVYLAPNIGAVVGSANLSKAALDEAETAGQDEAAVLVTSLSIVREIEQWFEDLWKTADLVKPTDLTAAKKAWDKAQKARTKARSRTGTRKGVSRVPPAQSEFDRLIVNYAKKVRSQNIWKDLREYIDFFRPLDPKRLTRNEQKGLVEYVASWTRHPGAYKTFLTQPIASVRRGLQLLFDEAVDLEDRLEQIHERAYLRGLRMPSLGLILYWRNPERYIPYNFRTKTFLRDFGLLAQGMSSSSPRCYATWLEWATRFGQRLSLPSLGHVDRLVERYYEDYGPKA